MIRYAVKTAASGTIIIPPLADVKENLRIESSDTTHDDYITDLIHAAREYCEYYLGWVLPEQTLYAYLDEFPDDGIIEIARGPVQSIVAVNYKAGSDTTYTPMSASNYELSSHQRDARLLIVDVPSINDERLDPIRIEYLAGFHDPTAVPKPILDALKLVVTERYLNPYNQAEGARHYAADRLMRPFKHQSY